MARILIGTVPVVGHINPFLPLVRTLAARGHEVRCYTGAKDRSRIEGAGAAYAPMLQARDAMRAVLQDESYRARALRDEYRRYDAVALATGLIEQLASTGRPVLRPEAQEGRIPVAALAQGD